MASCMDEFEEWLCTKLKALNTDQDVFSTYIRGILEGDETNDDKLEALEGILAEMQTDSNLTLSHEIIDKWESLSAAQNTNTSLQGKFDVDAQLASIMEKQAQSVVTERKVTEEERKYREAILAQYSHLSDGEDSDVSNEKDCKDLSSSTVAAQPVLNSDSLLSKNTNVEDVVRAEKEKRDKAKADVEKKKALDKANKEKQKQQQQERKEREKKRTQKGERKR